MKNIIKIVLPFFICASLFAESPEKRNSIDAEFIQVSNYIRENHRLPANYITKKEAKKSGWNPGKANLWKVAPGKSIGGDLFSNRERLLPCRKGRVWYEADIGYRGGKRGKYRILFSSDGLIYKTLDHYRTFQSLR